MYVVANKDDPAETVREATNNLPRTAIALFEFAYKNRGSSSQPAGPPPSIKHNGNAL